MIEEILLNFKSNLDNKNLDSIFFEITDINKIYNLGTCKEFNNIDDLTKILKFKLSSETLKILVKGDIHPEDLLFNEQIKITGDISILS